MSVRGDIRDDIHYYYCKINGEINKNFSVQRRKYDWPESYKLYGVNVRVLHLVRKIGFVGIYHIYVFLDEEDRIWQIVADSFCSGSLYIQKNFKTLNGFYMSVISSLEHHFGIRFIKVEAPLGKAYGWYHPKVHGHYNLMRYEGEDGTIEVFCSEPVDSVQSRTTLVLATVYIVISPNDFVDMIRKAAVNKARMKQIQMSDEESSIVIDTSGL